MLDNKKKKIKNFLIAFAILIIVMILFMHIKCMRKETAFVSSIVDPQKSITREFECIDERTNDYKIQAWYKVSNIKVLDDYTKVKMYDIVNNFKTEIARKLEKKVSQTSLYLTATFDEYVDEKYISYVINVTSFTGNINPDRYIYCINYDKKNNIIIFISDLEEKYGKNFLTKLSEYVKKEIKNNKKIKEFSFDNLNITDEYTIPIKENYEDFVITKEKIIVFFEAGKVMPKVFGAQKVEVPTSTFSKE